MQNQHQTALVDPEKATATNYQVPKGEEHKYHIKLEVKAFNPNTGDKRSKARIQKIGKKNYETHVYKTLISQGYEVTVLHNPNEWLQTHQEELRQRTAERAQEVQKKKENAEQSKIDAAVAHALEQQKAQFKELMKEEIAEGVAAAIQAEKDKKLSQSGTANASNDTAAANTESAKETKDSGKTAKAGK